MKNMVEIKLLLQLKLFQKPQKSITQSNLKKLCPLVPGSLDSTDVLWYVERWVADLKIKIKITVCWEKQIF